ncbi:hypothetical protein [Paraburkholderia sp. BL21I4N1]|uniref:hypothetical protein n=1 Tax=Paraburkholderia sp. BL21I4N1 TaxID=1938801 RepID=UPI000D43A479|nr:hypothetical protein [Paraburkholderia sp. BL21I4N1]PQV53326.1 hypothetical protein B0G83_102412 [Paraburkholderia sp. BL21I4N1]
MNQKQPNVPTTTGRPDRQKPTPALQYGALADEISWRSKVFDFIGRLVFGPTKALAVREGFYHVAAERPQIRTRDNLRNNVRDQFIRRDIRVWVSRRMLIVGAVLIVVSYVLNDSYTQALSASAQHFFN